MINELICRKCGYVFKKKDLPDIEDLEKALKEHTKTNHGLINSKPDGDEYGRTR